MPNSNFRGRNCPAPSEDSVAVQGLLYGGPGRPHETQSERLDEVLIHVCRTPRNLSYTFHEPSQVAKGEVRKNSQQA